MKKLILSASMLLVPFTVYADLLPLMHGQAERLYYNSHGEDRVTDRVGIGNPAGGVLYADPDDGYFYLHRQQGSTVRVTREDRLPVYRFPFQDVDWDGDGTKDGLNAYDETGAVMTANFVRSTTATYMGSDGLLRTAAIDEPRFGYSNMTSPTYGGLLLEDGATNYIEYSSSFGNWSSSFVTVTEDTASSPVFSNATGADTLRATDPSGFVSYSTTATGPGYHCFSVYIKAASAGSDGYISIGNDTDGFVNRTTVLTTQWQRFDVGANLAAAGEGVEARIYPGQTTVDVYAFGSQVEKTGFPTSYIPTEGATATRGRDDCWFAKPDWFDDAGSIVLDWTPLWEDSDVLGVNRHIVHWYTDTGLPQNYQSVLYQIGSSTSNTSIGYNDGSGHTDTFSQTRETKYKFAIQWSSADGTATVYKDDSVVLSDTYDGDFNQTASHPNIGLGYSNYGFIRNMIIFDRSDVEVGEW